MSDAEKKVWMQRHFKLMGHILAYCNHLFERKPNIHVIYISFIGLFKSDLVSHHLHKILSVKCLFFLYRCPRESSILLSVEFYIGWL